jgi:Zn-dependent protease with chaperone function
MGRTIKGCLVLITAGFLAASFTESDSASAAQEIAAAAGLMPTTRTTSENERMTRGVLRRLQTVAQPVCAATDRGSCWYTLEFSPKGEMNAYVIKNQIVMYNGLAQYLESEDEFAVVMAHEMGHHISGHYEKGKRNRTIGSVLGGIIFAGIAGATNAYGNDSYGARRDMRTAMELGAGLGGISFSKEHEREADYIAAYLLTRAGYNPESAGDVWVKLTKATGNMETGLLDSHPSGPDRLAAWKQSVDEVRYSADLMPNPAGAEAEPRLQTARNFSEPALDPALANTGVALASRSSSTPGYKLPSTGTALSLVNPSVPGKLGGGLRDATWTGWGERDSCGANWALKVEKSGKTLRGNMWWKNAKYDIYGDIDSFGRSLSVRAGKSKDARNTAGPRFFRLDITFTDDTAAGQYAVDSRTASCQTSFSLRRG